MPTKVAPQQRLWMTIIGRTRQMTAGCERAESKAVRNELVWNRGTVVRVVSGHHGYEFCSNDRQISRQLVIGNRDDLPFIFSSSTSTFQLLLQIEPLIQTNMQYLEFPFEGTQCPQTSTKVQVSSDSHATLINSTARNGHRRHLHP